MRAAVLRAPGRVIVEEIPEPVFGPYDVLCRTRAAAVCSGTDHHIVRNHPYFNVTFPALLGHEGIGEVIARGRKG